MTCRIFFFILSLMAIASNVNAAKYTLTLNTPLLKSHETQETKVMLGLVANAFSALNIDVTYRYRPDKRSIIEANSGVVDGELARIESIVDLYPNLVVVPEELATTKLVAFALKPNIDLSTYKIVEHNYKIGYLSGWKNATSLLKNYQNKAEIREYDVLFKLLVNNRLDIVIYNRTAGGQILNGMKVADYQTSSPLLSNSVYLFLHKRHAVLAPKVATQLKLLKSK